MKYKLIDPMECNGGLIGEYDTLNDAMKAADDHIDHYRRELFHGEEWPYEMDQIKIKHGDKVAAKCVEFDVIEKPDDLDEDGYSESLEMSFSCVDRYCNYKMEVIT
jgi:hypothetical protein